MNSYEKIIYELSPIKIYDLASENTIISKELKTYADALQNIDERIDLLLREMFLESCETEGVEKFSCLYGVDGYSAVEMKKYISAVLSGDFGEWNKKAWDFEKASVPQAIFSADGSKNTFCVNNFSALSKEEKIKTVSLIKKYISCHLFHCLSLGFRTWNEIEQSQFSFNDFGGLGLTFAEAEIFD